MITTVFSSHITYGNNIALRKRWAAVTKRGGRLTTKEVGDSRRPNRRSWVTCGSLGGRLFYPTWGVCLSEPIWC